MLRRCNLCAAEMVKHIAQLLYDQLLLLLYEGSAGPLVLYPNRKYICTNRSGGLAVRAHAINYLVSLQLFPKSVICRVSQML